ncbi:ATP-binding cassette domain-containing protein, partial [Pseudomonas aeruginosa]
MKDVALQLKNVGKSYGNKVVLESIDFEVRHGSMVALLGTSGAGKSTLF